jgi:hypothetical protein
MYKYRVLLQDKEKGFQFAIKISAENKTGSETLAQYGCTVEDGARWEAKAMALQEFPDADFVKAEYIEPPSYGYEPFTWGH